MRTLGLWIPVLLCGASVAADDTLVGHWPLTDDGRDRGPAARHAQVHGVTWTKDPASTANSAAKFDGRSGWLEVPGGDRLQLGTGDFTVRLKVHLPAQPQSGSVDLVNVYDPQTRRGWQLSLKSHAVTTSQVNYRNLHFGIDDGRPESAWQDHGRPGNAIMIFSLATHRGQLYLGTCEPGKDESGQVYAFAGTEFQKLPGATASNSVSALSEFEGALYAGTAKYRLAGSALSESENPNLGGRIVRRAERGWIDCGQLPEREAIGGLAVFQGRLLASSLYRPAGFYRYEGGTTWKELPTPGGKRVEAMGVWRGQLWASSYDEAHIYRFDGERWVDCGQVGDATNTQTYSFAIYQGELYVGTWRSGKVYRYAADGEWIDCGRLGEELEVMGMLVHNGRLYAGSLPLAHVFRYDGGTQWTSVGQVDATPNVTYRRAWTLAEFQGRLFVGTLPSGRLLSLTTGVNVTHDTSLTPGEHAVAAVRQGQRLRLYVDGREVATSAEFDPARYNLDVAAALRIGRGQNDFFEGRLWDLRIDRRALGPDELAEK